jgi:organic radical activating enzyme
MDQKLNVLIEQHKIDKIFLLRYFRHNAENRFASAMLEFMLWRRGTLLHPKDRDKFISDFMIEEIEAFYQKNEFTLPQIQFAVTTRCTLKCKDCNFFLPYFNKQKTSKDLSFVDFKKQLENLTQIIHTVYRFQFLGGEPLLCHEFPLLLAHAAKNAKISKVEIVTNGTMLPSMELLTVVKEFNHKIYFHISNYSVNESVKPFLKHEKLLPLLKENNIKYQMSTDMHWYREVPMQYHGYDQERLRAVFADCWAKRVIQVHNGRIAICPRTSGGYEMGEVPILDEECIDLQNSSDENLKDQFIKFYHRDHFNACQYCMRSEEEVLPASQI